MTTDTETQAAPAAAAPWHFWVVAAIAVLWNGFGGYDYTMSHLQGEAYYRQMGMSEAVIAAMASYPTWMHAVWAVGVWGSVAGAVLLVLRMRWAFHAFAISTLGALGSVTYTLLTPAMKAAMSPAMPIVIVVICLLFAWYSRTMTKRGVLR